MIEHPIPPVYDKNSKVLILGSFPSMKSREQGFFYGHPQNRFWKVIAEVSNQDVPNTIEEKKSLLLALGIAVWDVLASCEIVGSADSTIKKARPNNLNAILNSTSIKAIYVNGKTAKFYYDKYIRSSTGIDAICLPSTSPANATYSLSKLIEAWSIITK